MLTIPAEKLPVPEAELRAALQRYRDAKEAHKTTVGVPAPLPEHDILFVLAQHDDFTVAQPTPPQPPVEDISPAALELKLRAAVQAHIDAGARGKGFMGILDAMSYVGDPDAAALQAEVALLRRWRSQCWAVAKPVLTDVLNGLPAPAQDVFLSSLPPLTQPGPGAQGGQP